MISKSTSVKSVLLVLAVLFSLSLNAQTDGDYQFNYTDSGDPVADWNWNDASNWQVYSSGWIAAANFPGDISGAGNIFVRNGDQIILSADISQPIGSISFDDGTTLATSIDLNGYDLTVTGAIAFGNPTGNVDFYEQAISVTGAGSVLECGSVEMVNTGDDNEDTRIYVPEGTLIVNGDINQPNSNRNGIWFRAFDSAHARTGGELYIYGDYNGNGFDRGNTSTVFYQDAGAQVVGNCYYQNIQFSGGDKTFRNSTYVYGTLTLDAVVDINNRQLYLDQGSSVVPGSSYGTSAMFAVSNGGRIYHDVNEESDLDGMIYPVSFNGEYTPLTITDITASGYSNGTYLLTRFYDVANSLTVGTDNQLTRYWNFQSNLNITSADITFTYSTDDASAPITESNLGSVGQFVGTSWDTWTDADSEVSIDHDAPNEFSFNGNTTLIGDWTLGENAGCFDATSYSGTVSVQNGSWDNPLTWNTGVIPNPLSPEDVTILHTITPSSGYSGIHVNSLTIGETGNLNVNRSSVAIDNNFVIDGIFSNGHNNNPIITVGGDLIVNNGSNVNIQNSEMLVSGDANVAGYVRDSDDDGYLTISGSLNILTGGNFNAERSVLNVTNNVNVAASLRDSRAEGTITIGGTLNIQNGGNFDIELSELTVTGDVTVEAGGILRDTNQNGISNFNSNLTIQATGDFDLDESILNVAGNVSVAGILDDSDSEATGVLNISGNLSVALGGSFHLQNGVVNITGTTDVYGTLYDTDGDGTNTFGGKLTVHSGGDFNSNQVGHVFPAVIENNGSFVISSNYAFTNDITFTGTSTIQFTNTSNFIIGNNITLTNQNTGGLNLNGNIVVNNGSTLKLDANSVLQIGDGYSLTNNGILQVVGAAGNPATITTSGSGGYLISQSDAAAEFHALYGVFDATGGITITDGTVDATNNFSHTSFTNGTGTEYLQLTNYDPIGGLSSVQSAVFETGPSYNVSRTSGTATVNFVSATGNLAGENHDNDNGNPGSLIDWSNPGTTYYSQGDVSAGLISSWNSNPLGGGSTPVSVTDGTATLIVQDGHTVTLDSNGDINVRELYVGEGTSGVFNIGGDATQQTLVIQELLEVGVGATLQPGSAGTPGHILQLYGNLINNGTINLRQSFTSLVNTEIYGNMLFGGTNTPIFSEISFESGCNATANVPLDINWNLILESGATFNDGGNTHKVEYNWTNNGGVYNATGGLEFDGGTSSITSSGTTTTFNDVTFNGGGLATVNQAIIMNGDLDVTNNTKVSIGDVAITINGDFTIDTGAEYAQASNYTYFSGTNAQTISLDGITNFNRIVCRNGGTNAKTFVGDLVVNNWLMIDNGATVDGAGNQTISGGLRVNGTCDFSGTITMMNGTIDATDLAVTAFDLGTAEVIIKGPVSLAHSTGGGTVDITANRNITVTESGYLVINNDATLIGQAGYALTLEAGRNLYVRGTDNFPNGFGTYDFDPTANVVYDANIPQVVRGGFTYGRVYFRYANTKTVDGPLNITGQLYLREGATLDLANYSHTFSGSVIYNGTSHNGSIDGSNATFTIGGADYNQTIEASGTGTYNFNNLVLTQNGATATRSKTFNAGSNIVVTDNLTVENIGGTEAIQHNINLNDNAITGTTGTFSLGSYCWLYVDHLDFGSDVIDNFASTSFDVNSTVYYSLNGGEPNSGGNPIDPAKNQNIADGVTYGNLTFYHGNKIAEGSLDINGDLTRLGTPVFYDGGFTHNIAGDWQLYSTWYYTQASATGTIVFDGVDQDINGLNFNNITIASSGTANAFNNLTIYGDVVVNDASSFNVSTLNMTVAGDVTVNGTGEYLQSTGRTTLNGDANQNVSMNATSTFGYLTINKTNPVSQTVTALSELHINEDVDISAMAGIFDFSNQNLYVGDDFYIRHNTGVQNLITTGSTVYFNGSSSQVIRTHHEDNLVFNNIVFEGSGDKQLTYSDPGSGLIASRNFEINGDFTINSTVLDGYVITLYVRGDWINNGTFNHNRTVYFDGADQNISPSGFYHVNFQGTDTKTLGGNIAVSYDLYIDGTATLNADGNDITLGRHWYNNVATANYVHGNGKVVFNGASGAYAYTGTTSGSLVGKNFYAVDINKTNTAYLSLQGDLFIEQDLNVNSQILYTNAYDVWVGENFNAPGTYNCNNNNSMLTLNATGGTYNFNPNGATLRGLTINAPAATYEMQSDFILDNVNMSIDAGTLNVNDNQIQLNDGGRTIDINGGTLNVGAGSTLLFTNTQNLNLNSGELHIVGVAGISANLSNTHADNPFTINALGGTLYANYYRVQNGRIIVNGASIDGTNNLSGGTFVEGDSGTSYITLSGVDLGSGISLSNMIFNSGADHNITRTSGNGVVTVLDASGGMAGEYYEEDDGVPGTLIDWTFPAGYFWDGEAGDNNWHTALNWLGNTAPGITDIVYFDHSELASTYTVNINGADASAMRINMDTQSGNPILLNVGSGITLDVQEHVFIGAGATLSETDNTSLINVGGNWTNQGTFTPNSGKVAFNAASGNYIISSGGAGVGNAFYDLELNAGTSAYTLDLPLTILNDLTVTSGTLDLASPNNDVNIGGDWHIDQGNGGVFISNNADVTFDGTLQSIDNGIFYNLIIESTSTTTLSSNIAVEHDFTLSSGATFDAQDRNMYVRLNWTNNGGTFTQTGLGTVVFDASSGTQNIDNGSHSTTFNNLTFSNAAGKIFRNNVSVNGNVLINDNAGVVNVDTYILNGIGASNKLTCNEDLQIQGASNFPTGFETLEFSNTSLVSYYADIDQDIYPTTYGGLSLRRGTDGAVLPVKRAMGDLIITGTLYLNSVNRPAELDMEENDANIILTGSIDLRGTSVITWGTGDATIEHVGVNWYIDSDIPSFNNVILAGTNDKYTQGNLNITGDLTIKSGVDLMMYTTGGRDNFRLITGTASGTVSMETGARILNSRPATDGVAIPEGFGSYDFNESSTYVLYSNGIDQTVYTGTNIAYGNLTFSSTKNVTGDGMANLDVNGNWNLNTATYYDGGTDMEVAGSNIYFNRYVASSTDRKLMLDGSRDQRLEDDDDNQLNLPTVEFKGIGIKTIADATQVTGNWTIDTDVTVRTGSNIEFSGSSWLNNGYYQQTNNALTFNGLSDQTIDPGTLDADNYFRSLTFEEVSTKTFVNNGADINNDITISEGTVDLGNLEHYLYDELYNTTGGVLLSSNADLVLDGGTQYIQSPNFTIDNITCSGNGSKLLCSDWTINSDLLIESGSTLDSRSTIVGVTTDYDIYIGGDWINNGNFQHRNKKVTFNGNLSPVTITSGGVNFYDVEFSPSATVNYSLLSPSTTIRNQMNIEANAELDLNGQTLIVGRDNTAAVTHTVNGTLTIDEGATLSVNNDDGQATLDVYGDLNIVGVSATEVATLTSATTSTGRNKTLVNIQSGANIAARYYLIEYIADEGLNLMPGSTLDATNNFSDGTFLGMRNQSGARYIQLESNYAGGTISNISFSYDGVPVQGTHFNVKRELTAPDITFDNVTGSIGSYRYEDDEEVTPSHNSGRLRWPEITETNWTGAVDIDWHKDGNWDNGVPTAIIDAIIGDEDIDPIIFAADAVCKSLIITDGTLRLEDDMNIVVNSNVGIDAGVLYVNAAASTINVGGDWTVNTYGNYVHGQSTVVFDSPDGSVNIVPRTSNFYNVVFDNAFTTFNISGSTVNVDGDFTIFNGTVSPSTNNYTYNLLGDYTITGGTYNATSSNNGEFVLAASGDQVVTDAIFDNLVVDGTGNKQFEGSIVVEGTTEINSSLVAQATSNIQFNGRMTIDAAGTFDDGGESHQFSGDRWYGYGTYLGNGTITFNRTNGNQDLYQASFNNLDIACDGRILYLREDVNLTGDLTFRSSVNYVNLLTSTITGDGSGTFAIEGNRSVYLYGANNFPKAFATYTIDANSFTRYYGSSDQNIDGVSYGHLVLDNANTKTLTGNAEVKGNLYFNETTLDVSVNNYSLTVGGHWYNNNGGGGNFVCRSGEVIFNNTAARNIYAGDANLNTFYDLTISGAERINAANSTNNDFIVQNNLNVSSGEFSANGRTVYVGGDLTANGSGGFVSSGTYYLNKASGTAIISANGSPMWGMTINSGAVYTVLDDLDIRGNYTLTSGTFDGNGNTIDIGNDGSDVVVINGTYIVGAGGVLGLGNGVTCTVGTTGRVEVVGSTGGLAKVTNNSSGGRYGFIVDGEIAAEYYMFEYMSNVGVYLTNTSTIDATNHFSNGTFSNGANTGQLFRVENTQTFNDAGSNRIENVSFPVNPGGSASNVAKYVATSGELEFYNSVGVFAGENYDNDTRDLISWTGPVHLTWNGSVDTDWNKAANWTASSGGAIVPTSANNVFIPGGLIKYPELSVDGQETGNLTIESGAELRISTSAGDLDYDLNIDGDFTIEGSLSTSTTEDIIAVEGNWSASSGSVVLLNGNVTFDGVGGAKQIDNRSSDFYSLTISGSTQYQVARNTDINNNLVIEAGATFDANPADYTITIKGDWQNEGTFIAQQGTVIMDASSGPRTIASGGSNFYNLRIDASGINYSMTDNLSVNSLLQLSDGILDAQANTLKIGDGSGIDGISISGSLLINEGATLDMDDGSSLNVNSGGSMELLGTNAANRAVLTSSTGGRYSFDVNSGASIKAQYYTVDYTDADGLFMHPGANIDAVNNLSDGVFSNGAAGGSYMTLRHDMATEDFTLSNLVFNVGPAHSVTRTAGWTKFLFEDALGDLGNYLYERDEEATPSPSSGLLRWPFVNLYTWEGDEDNNWFNAGNWFDDVMPDVASTVTITELTGGEDYPVLSGSVEIHGMVIENNAQVTISAGSHVTLNGDLTGVGSLIVNNTIATPTSLIVNGAATNANVQVDWTYTNNRYFYVGHGIEDVNYSNYDNVTSNAFNLYRYSGNWSKTSSGVLNNSGNELQGYAVLFKESSNVKVSHTGQLNNGSYSRGLSGNSLIANPYQAYLDVEEGGFGLPSDVSKTIYTSSNETGGLEYAAYSLATHTGVNGGTQYIAPGQSFWVVGNSATNLTIDPSARTHSFDVGKGMLKSAVSAPDDILRFKIYNEDISDELALLFRPDGALESTWKDSKKRMGSGAEVPNLFAIKGDTKLAIGLYPETEAVSSVSLGYKFSQVKELTIEVTNINQFDGAEHVILIDKLEGVMVDLNEESEYKFITTGEEETDRFEIVFESQITTDIDEKVELSRDVMVYCVNQKAVVKVTSDVLQAKDRIIEVYNITGQLINTHDLNSTITEFELPQAYPMYIIKVSVDNSSYQRKVITKM